MAVHFHFLDSSDAHHVARYNTIYADEQVPSPNLRLRSIVLHCLAGIDLTIVVALSSFVIIRLASNVFGSGHFWILRDLVCVMGILLGVCLTGLYDSLIGTILFAKRYSLNLRVAVLKYGFISFSTNFHHDLLSRYLSTR